MKRIFLILVNLIAAAAVLPACTGAPAAVSAGLGQEFSLPLGQEAVITGEDLRIAFNDVVEDSRCPQDVTCVWEGRAIAAVTITYQNTPSSVVLTEPGLTDGAEDTFQGYGIVFHLEPYPRSGQTIAKEDYSLRMTISKGGAFFTIDDRAGIYAAVIRQLYTVDHTFGEPPNFPVLYIVYNTMDSIGDPDAPQSASIALPEELRTAVTDRLSDLPAEYRWVGSQNEVQLENGGIVPGGGAIVTLGNIS